MTPKIILAAFAAMCFVGFAAGTVTYEYTAATKLCKSQLDCDPNECCAKRFMRKESYCVHRRRLNEICIHGELGNTLIDGVYDITCPCEKDLKCIKEIRTKRFDNGEEKMETEGNPRCREPTYPGSSPYSSSTDENSL